MKVHNNTVKINLEILFRGGGRPGNKYFKLDCINNNDRIQNSLQKSQLDQSTRVLLLLEAPFWTKPDITHFPEMSGQSGIWSHFFM